MGLGDKFPGKQTLQTKRVTIRRGNEGDKKEEREWETGGNWCQKKATLKKFLAAREGGHG